MHGYVKRIGCVGGEMVRNDARNDIRMVRNDIRNDARNGTEYPVKPIKSPI
jgi:hypothetical protein